MVLSAPITQNVQPKKARQHTQYICKFRHFVKGQQLSSHLHLEPLPLDVCRDTQGFTFQMLQKMTIPDRE